MFAAIVGLSYGSIVAPKHGKRFSPKVFGNRVIGKREEPHFVDEVSEDHHVKTGKRRENELSINCA